MKIKTLLFMVFCAVPVAQVGAPSEQMGKPATGTAYFFSPIDTGFSDLDVRDANGQADADRSSHEALESLFRESLVNLLVVAPPHITTETMDWLTSISNLFNKHIWTRMLAIFGFFQ